MLGLVLDAEARRRDRLQTGLADRVAAGLAVAVCPAVDTLDRRLELLELQLGVLEDAVVDLEADRLARQLGGVLLGGGELTLGRLLGVGGEPVRGMRSSMIRARSVSSRVRASSVFMVVGYP